MKPFLIATLALSPVLILSAVLGIPKVMGSQKERVIKPFIQQELDARYGNCTVALDPIKVQEQSDGEYKVNGSFMIVFPAGQTEDFTFDCTARHEPIQQLDSYTVADMNVHRPAGYVEPELQTQPELIREQYINSQKH